MASDPTYGPKIRLVEQGDTLDVAPGGKITANGTQAAAPTAALTAITHTAPGTPDYAIQDLVQNTGFGFVTADEGNTVLSVIANLQTRVAELEAAAAGVGITA